MPKAGANWDLTLQDSPSKFQTRVRSADHKGYMLDIETEGTRFVMGGCVRTGYRVKVSRLGPYFVLHPTTP